MSQKTPALSLAFGLVCDLAIALNVRNIKDLPGCWEHVVDPYWSTAVNGHKQAVRTSKGQEIEPYQCWIEFNGWPAGYIGPYGGVIAAGEAANEETFVAALQAAIAKAKEVQ